MKHLKLPSFINLKSIKLIYKIKGSGFELVEVSEGMDILDYYNLIKDKDAFCF
jgi:hypothetical protein